LEELTKNELDDRIKAFYSLSQFELVWVWNNYVFY
jgi:hypothetical protein